MLEVVQVVAAADVAAVDPDLRHGAPAALLRHLLAPADLEPLLAIGCPTILYPYAREAISDLVTRAGFPPVVLQAVSFEQMYLQRQQGAGGARIEAAQ